MSEFSATPRIVCRCSKGFHLGRLNFSVQPLPNRQCSMDSWWIHDSLVPFVGFQNQVELVQWIFHGFFHVQQCSPIELSVWLWMFFAGTSWKEGLTDISDETQQMMQELDPGNTFCVLMNISPLPWQHRRIPTCSDNFQLFCWSSPF